jgi:hypothetical protein
VKNPCPSGYKILTATKLEAERLSWVISPISCTNKAAGAFSLPLKLPLSGCSISGGSQQMALNAIVFKKNNLIAKLIVEREIIIEEIERADREMKVG